MKINLSVILATSLALGGAGISAAIAADDHHHHGSIAELQLNQGQKWQTDAPLRKGMDAIRTDLAARLSEIHDNTLTPAQYNALAASLNGHVEYMVKNCQLPPDADAQLHLVLAEVLQGAHTMHSGHDRQEGAVRVVRALDAYGEHFAHPGWAPLAH